MSQDAEHRKDAEMSPAKRDLAQWLDEFRAFHDKELLGSETVARLHDQNGFTRLSNIERLRWYEAKAMLQFISGADSEVFDAAYEHVRPEPIE